MLRHRLSRLVSLPMLVVAALGRVHAADKPNASTFDANGVKIAYYVQGKGEPVVLIHGWLSSASMNWALPGITDLLARDHQVIALDVRGHGLSDKPMEDDAYGPELVQDVVRLMDRLQIKQAHIVGYSMGGIVAGNFIVKHPDRVLSGTLGGMGWLKQGDIAQFAFSQIGRNDQNQRAQAVCGRSLAKLALTEAELKAIKKPITVLVGSDDRFVKRLYVEPLQRVRPDWPVVEIADGNHFTCIVRPQFKDEIAAWLKKQPKQRR